MSSYAPLWVKSNGSFLEGASHPQELVERAHLLGLPAVAITDREGVYGVVKAYEKAKELSMKLLLGAEVHLHHDGDDRCTTRQVVILLAQDREGWGQLCQLLSIGRRRADKGSCTLFTRDLLLRSAGLIALFVGDREAEGPQPDRMLVQLREAFGDRLYALVTRHRVPEDRGLEQRMRRVATKHDVPIVANTEVLYHHEARRPLQDVITCVRHQVRLSEAGRLIRTNDQHALHGDAFMRTLFADDLPALERSAEIAARCSFSLAQLRYRYPSSMLPSGMTSAAFLRQRAYDGAKWRYGEKLDCARAQLDKELGLIEELDYCGYFISMAEIVDFCRDANILCQGRGSAANSVVCYCLGITAVDPIERGFLFERFISRERAEPPDIDLDLEHERREEAIQHMYKKYGRDHAAMVANVIRYRARSAFRDVGRVLGFAETTLDRMSKMLSHYDSPTEVALTAAGLDAKAATTQRLVGLAQQLQGFPRHLSIHPGGFILGHDPVHSLVPIENATMEDRTVIQWDKDDVETLGLFKVDLLALGALSHLHHCFDLLKQHRDIDLTLATIPADDEATYDLICNGDTVGVFQIESRAQMSMLPRLRPRKYYDLVIQVSIVRPGPITGGMVHPFLRRRSGQEEVTYPHELLRPVLERTLGVPLFQEQVMRVAMVAADYTPGEADQLRRDMGAWRRGGKMEQHRERLITRMVQKGIKAEFAENVYKQICGFGEYGFPESHAASFALISYAGSYLRTHYPEVFTCGLLNAQPMGFYSPATIVEDALRHGVKVLPIDVSVSQWDCTLDASRALRVGLRYIKALSRATGERVIAARQVRQFASVVDLRERARLDAGALSSFAEAGACDSLHATRRDALWTAQAVGRAKAVPLPVEETSAPQFPSLSREELIGWDYQRSGHSTRGHPLSELRPALRARGLPTARELAALPNGRSARYAGLVICRQRPGTASGVVFMTLEDETGFVNLVVWSQVFERHVVVGKSEYFLGVSGKVQKQDGVMNLIAESLWRPQSLLEGQGPVEVVSRNFH